MKNIHKNKILTILVVAIAMMVPSVAMAQSDGGKKKKKARTEQAASIKKRANKQQQTKQKPTTGTIAGHEWVDLGLPSGLKWATCNVGASSPEEYGDYFAWGETKPKANYDENNSLTYGKNMSELRSAGIIGKGISLTNSHDAAYFNWGGSWRMPTRTNFEELLRKCSWEWISNGEHNGYTITGPNGNSIFLPAAGTYVRQSLIDLNEEGNYLSSTRNLDSDRANVIIIKKEFNDTFWTYRFFGHSIRPVTK